MYCQILSLERLILVRREVVSRYFALTRSILWPVAQPHVLFEYQTMSARVWVWVSFCSSEQWGHLFSLAKY